MAFGAKKIYPIDTRPGTGVGVAIPFNAPGVFKTTLLTSSVTTTVGLLLLLVIGIKWSPICSKL